MKDRHIGFIILLIFGAICFGIAIEIVIKDTGLDINKSTIIVGRVTGKDIVRVRGSRNILNLFYFTLNNSDQKFTIYRYYQGYSDLLSGIHTGDTLKVYYRPNLSGYNRDVYQVEKNGLVLENYASFNEYSSSKAFLFLCTGIMFIVIGLKTFFNIKIWKVLNYLVDPPPEKDNN